MVSSCPLSSTYRQKEHTESTKYAVKDETKRKMISERVGNDFSRPEASRAAEAIITIKNVRMS